MNRFGPDPNAFFKSIYAGDPPWDIGGPQPALAGLIDRYPPEGPILDLGCGSGDLAIHLAKLGHSVLGIDVVEEAVESAREKAAKLPTETSDLLAFTVADGLDPASLNREFGAVVDSGFYHLFDSDQGERLIDEIVQVLPLGGRFYLLAFGVTFDIPNVPRAVTEPELRDRFSEGNGWRILEVRPGEFLSRVAPPVPAIGGCFERLWAGRDSNP